MFPHRATPNAGAGVSTQMVVESGNGVYGHNAIKALQGVKSNSGLAFTNTQANTVPLNADQITASNYEILSKINQFGFDYQNPASTNFQPLPTIGGKAFDGNSTKSTFKSHDPNAITQPGNRLVYTSDASFRRNIGHHYYSNQMGRGQTFENGSVHNIGGVPQQMESKGLQASHLGVYRHDASLSLIRP